MKPATTAFQWPRFKRLLRAQWAEQRRGYGRFWLVVAAIHGLVMLISLIISSGATGHTNSQAFFFWIGLFASGIIFSGLYFSALRRPESTLLLLTRPATALEKLLTAAFFTLVLWPLAYTASTTLINILASNIGQLFHQQLIKEKFNYTKDFTLFIPFLQTPAISFLSQVAFLLIYTGLSGYTLFGSIYFNKNAGIKTGALTFVVFLLTIFISLSILPQNPDSLAWWKENQFADHFPFRRWLSNILFWLLLPTLIWLCALLALREKDLT